MLVHFSLRGFNAVPKRSSLIRRLCFVLPTNQRGVFPMVGVEQRSAGGPSLGLITGHVFVRDVSVPVRKSHFRFFRLRFFVAFKSRTALHQSSCFPCLFVRTEYMLL
jgi:hypothetical protein